MVDSINPTNQTQSIAQTTNRAQKEIDKQKAAEISAKSVEDEVQISDEALSLAQAEDAARQAAQELAKETSLSLSSDVNRLNDLL